MTIMDKNSLMDTTSRGPGMTIVDDNGRMTVFHPNAPEPVVPYWNPNLHSFRRSLGALENMQKSVRKGIPALDLFEGFLMSNLPLGEDVYLKSDRGFWVGDALCFQEEITADAITGEYSIFNLGEESSQKISEGAFIPAGEIIIRATGFLRQEGYFGTTDIPYEKMKDAIGDNDAMEKLRTRYSRPKMEVTGYSPATCLLWILDASKVKAGETIDSIGPATGARIGVESGTVSVMTFEYSDSGLDYSDAMDGESRDGSIFGSSVEGFLASSATIGDGVYYIYPVYNANTEIIGHVVDFCDAFGDNLKKKKSKKS